MARGGYRPGAGRKKGSKTGAAKQAQKKPIVPKDIADEAAAEKLDPLAYMLKVMNDSKADAGRRDRMAVAAAPFMHARKGEGGGKKEEKEDRAKRAASGKFAAGQAPLKVVK